MANTALMSLIAALTAHGEKVAEMLGLDFSAEDAYTAEPLRADGMDPQLNLRFTRKGANKARILSGERFDVLAIARDGGLGLSMVPDGDTAAGDWEGFRARQPWHAAVCEELAVLLRRDHPFAAGHLRMVALDLHTPQSEAGFEELFAPPESAEFGR